MCVQFVMMRPQSSVPREVYWDLARRMVLWLKLQPGFVAYELYERPNGWFDRIAWGDEACAKAGVGAFSESPLAKHVLPLIEEGYQSIFGQAVISESRTEPETQ